ncbi:MAG: zinc-ribbon domain-containing protein [Myxococcota bacterium]
MLISCEKCSTTYVLDDALIPPQGAPVQCTRCGHVFTAKLPTKDLASTMPGPPNWDAGKKPGSSTIAFGQPAQSNAAPPAGSQTLAFGAVGASAPPAKQTAMFGAPAAAPPPAPAGKQTMVFGAPGAASPAPPPGKQTMVFGAPGAAAPAPPPGKQTMVFGAPGAPPAAPAPSKQTMVFGAPVTSAPAPPAGKQTMVFGAPAAASPPAAAPAKQTMVFGAPAAAPAASSPQPSTKQTMVFGAAAAPVAAPAPPVGKQTMVFGAVPPSAAPEPATAAPQQPARNQTMMFGRVPGGQPKVTPNTPGQHGSERSESTVRVDLEAMMRGQGAEDFEAAQARHDRTQRYAMTDASTTTPSEGAESVEARHNRTQLFAMSSQQETTKPDANAPPGPQSGRLETTLPPSFAEMPTLEPDAQPPAVVPPGGHPTLVFGAHGPRAQVTTDPGLDPPGVRVLLEPGMVTPPEASAASPEPIATTLPNLAPIERGHELPPLRVDLPPEPTFPASPALPQPIASAGDDEAMADLRAGSNRRTAIAVVIFLVIALGLGLAVLWHLFGRSLLGGGAATGEALAKTEQAVAALRMDDADTRARSIADLNSVLATRPELLEARAGLVLALAFAYDDANAHHALLEARARHQGKRLAKELAEAKKRKTMATGELKPELDKLQAAYAALPPNAPDALPVLRALAVAYGVLGDSKAIELSVQHKQQRTGDDDWADLAMPEYQVAAGASIPEAIEQLNEVRNRKTNSTFFRVLVLTARLHLKAGDAAAAEDDLKTVTTLNSRHQLAAELLDHVVELKAAASASPTPPSAAREPGLDGE